MADSTASLTWTPPPIEEPDITYCVDIHRSNSKIDFECAIEETNYCYPILPDSACHIYQFIVTPVNVLGFGHINSINLTSKLINVVVSKFWLCDAVSPKIKEKGGTGYYSSLRVVGHGYVRTCTKGMIEKPQKRLTFNARIDYNKQLQNWSHLLTKDFT